MSTTTKVRLRKVYGYAIQIKGSNASGKTFERDGSAYAVWTSGKVDSWVVDTATGERAVFNAEQIARLVAYELLWNGQTFALRRAVMA